MSSRLQVLVPEGLDARIREAAEGQRVTIGEWVRRAIERALVEERKVVDPLARLGSLDGPTADIEQMLAEIEVGRS